MRANGLSPERSCTSRRIASGGVLRLVEHDLGRRRVADAVVLGERLGAEAARGEPVGEADGVEDRLAGAVRAARIHRMRRVAEQRDAAEAPARQRILVDHRIGEHGLGRADQRGDVEPVEVPVGEGGEEVVEAAARVPVAPHRLGAFELGDPVDELAALARRSSLRIG